MSLEPEQQLAFEQYVEEEGNRKLREFAVNDHFIHPTERDVVFNPNMAYEHWIYCTLGYPEDKHINCIDTINRWLSEDTSYDIAYGMFLREEWLREECQ